MKTIVVLVNSSGLYRCWMKYRCNNINSYYRIIHAAQNFYLTILILLV